MKQICVLQLGIMPTVTLDVLTILTHLIPALNSLLTTVPITMDKL